MANWLSIQSIVEKYGISEEQVREWIRLDYVTYSSLEREPYDDANPLVDADELDKALELNSIKSYPDDETIERVPKGHLDWLYRENERLAEINTILMEENRLRAQWEDKFEVDLAKMEDLTNNIISLHRKVVADYEAILNYRIGIWSFLRYLFFHKNNKSLT